MVERKRSAFFRGEAGARKTEQELERQKERAAQRKASSHMPFRFRVNVGKSKQMIVCDDKPDFFMYEHALRDQDGKYGRLYSGCVKDFDNCPVCEMKKDDKGRSNESYYAMFLTVIDLEPFTLRDGTEVEFSRKLLVVKPAQQKKFLRFYQKEGTLRGALFTMTRDGDKDSAIGNDIEFEEFVPEKEMQTYTRSWKDREGKKHSENCDEPFVYEELFEEPTADNLRALVGGEPAPGSRRQSERAVGSRRRNVDEEEDQPKTRRAHGRTKDDDWEAEDDEAPFDPDPPRRGKKDEEDEKPSRRRAAREEPEEDEKPSRGRRSRQAEPEEEEAPKARRRGAKEPEDEPEEETPRRARRGRPEPEEESEEEPEEEAPRRGARPTRGKAKDEEPEEPEEQEEPEEDETPARRPARRPTRGKVEEEPEDEPEERPARRRPSREPEPEPERPGRRIEARRGRR